MITTLIVNYNSSNFIKLCVDSVLKQPHNSKIILCDDGSNDGSPSIIDGYAKQCEVIKNSKTLGFNTIKNIALQKCTTPLLSVVETQSLLYDNRYTLVMEQFQKYQDVSLVYSDFDFFNLKTSKILRFFSHPYNVQAVISQPIIPHIAVFKTDVIKSIGGFSQNDNETYGKMLQKSVFSYIPESTYLQRGLSE